MLYFIDESGHDLGKAPCAVLGGVALREDQIWSFAKDFTALKASLLLLPEPDAYDAKGSKLLTRRVFKLANSREAFASAERDVLLRSLHAKNAEGDFVTRNELAALNQAKLEFVREALALGEQYAARVFLSIVPRGAPRQADDSFLRKDFSYLFQRIHCDVSDAGGSEQGILVFDELDPHLCHRLLGQMRKYFVETRRGQERAERVIPLPFFVHSDLTPPIQLADIVAYIGNWGLRMPRMNESARDELRPFADRVFALRYRGHERRGFSLRRGAPIWGVSYIPDLRPRSEHEIESSDEEAQEPESTRKPAEA